MGHLSSYSDLTFIIVTSIILKYFFQLARVVQTLWRHQKKNGHASKYLPWSYPFVKVARETLEM